MEFDAQGHRGFRGKFPENTLIGFEEAIKTGVKTLEMDVVLSKDKLVVVSHDAVMLKNLCLDPNGKPLKDDSVNLFTMKYEKIMQYDCGSLGNPKFPNQKKVKSYKPLLNEVITAADEFTAKHNLPDMRFNIEIKSNSAGDGIFHPKPALYAETVVDTIKLFEAEDRCTIQSFDLRILQYLERVECDIPLCLLVENDLGVEKNIDLLGFEPDVYGVYHKFLNEEDVALCQTMGMEVIPWTVNDKSEMKKLIDWGVDGLISDYPDLLMEVVKESGVE